MVLVGAQFFVDNDLKGLITHGGGIDLETLNLIRGNLNIMLGIGPDGVNVDEGTIKKIGQVRLIRIEFLVRI